MDSPCHPAHAGAGLHHHRQAKISQAPGDPLDAAAEVRRKRVEVMMVEVAL